MCIGLGSMQFVLENGQQYDWFDDARIRWFTFFSIAGLAAFVWWTLRSTIPVVDLRVLKLRQVAAGSILGAVLGVSLYGSIIILAAVSHQLARIHRDALGSDGHDPRRRGARLYAADGDLDAARARRSASCKRRSASFCSRSPTGGWAASRRRSPISTVSSFR